MWNYTEPVNDMNTIPTYAPGTRERERLVEELARLERREPVEIPLIIGGREVTTGRLVDVRAPHDRAQVLARAHLAGPDEIQKAIQAALDAHPAWSQTHEDHRAAVFMGAADRLAGPDRTAYTAAIMANHSKTPYEAEIDLAEMIDFFRFNAHFMLEILKSQPRQHPGEMNRLDWRPLEGFVAALTPFNFFAIGGNLPSAPALAGNVAVWKPATSTIFSNYLIMRALMDAGLPPGVINFVPFSSRDAAGLLEHPALAGVHFTGSYGTLSNIMDVVSRNLGRYRNIPRIVGETGGKDFVVAHPSADARNVALNLIRGAFEYQGQKCSAASRAYLPQSLWGPVQTVWAAELPLVQAGPVGDFTKAMGAVIDEASYRNIVGYIDYALGRPDEYRRISGGGYDESKGWFVQPTIFETRDPKARLMTEEIFGPVLTVYVYPDEEYEAVLDLVDQTSPYALTGAVFARDRDAAVLAERKLRYAAGNFYINDKPTGSIVGRQPFGGGRHSGTNDKAGFWLNVTRWMSPRTIKETTLPAGDWRRGYMG